MKNLISAVVRLRAVALLVAFVGTGCTCLRTADPQPDQPEEKAQIEKRLQEIFTAAENKDFAHLDRYHAYGPNFTKYSGSSAERQDATAGRKGEHDGLGAVKGLKMRAQGLKIDVFGNTGIATFILDYNFDSSGGTIYRKDRSTIVFVKEGGNWKITHEHLTPVQP